MSYAKNDLDKVLFYNHGSINDSYSAFPVCPQTLEFQIADLDSEKGSGRTQAGTMTRDRKAIKRKLVCTFPPMNREQMSNVLHAVHPQFFNLRYPDAYTGAMRNMTCYVGDRSAPVFVRRGNDWIYEPLKVDFIEK